MKRNFMFIAVMLLSGAMAMAQTANVKKANNALLTDPVNYDEARSYIEQAKQDPSTATDAKTWYVAGRIGYSLANKEWNKRYINQNPDADLLYTGLKEMFENYLKADSFDGKELDKKGNPKYTQRKNIKGDFKEMLGVYEVTGGEMYNKNEFAKAYEMYSEYIAIADLPIFDEKEKSKVKIDTIYNRNKYNAAISALRAEKNDDALRILDELAKSDYANKQAVYELMTSVYQSQGDTAKYVQSLKDGLEAYPKSEFFIGNLVNYYIQTNNYNEALEYLDGLIANQPNDMEYYYLKIELLTQLKQYDKAKETVDGVLSKPDQKNNPIALYLKGECVALEGDSIQVAAQEDLKLSPAEYNKRMAAAKELFKEAIKYCEEAKQTMEKTDARYTLMLQNMKQLYMQINGAGSPEYKAIDAELKSIQ